MVEQKGKEGFQKLLDEMSYIGLLEYDYGYHYDHNGRTAPQSERRYTLPMFVPGSAELFNMEEDAEHQYANPRLEAHPDLAAFFERMTYIPLDGITQMVPPGGAGVGMHVIPVEKAISMENEAIDIEKLSYWLSKYEGKIGVGRCSCRASRKAIGEGVADDDYVLVSEISQTTAVRPVRVMTLQKRKHLRFCSVQKTMDLYIRLQILMVKIKSLVSATVM